MLSSEQLLAQQQDRLAANQGDTARQIIALYKAMGGGWEIRRGRETVSAEVRKEMKARTDWGEILD